MKQFKTINQNKADMEIGYKEQKQHLIDIMKLDEDLGLYDEPKQETLEEVAKIISKEHYVDRSDYWAIGVDSFKRGAKWQQERSYSEEDMRNAFDSAREFNSLDGVVDVHIVLPMGGDMLDLQPLHFTFEQWFEQFKKK